MSEFDVKSYLHVNRLQQRDRILAFFRGVSKTGDGHLYAISFLLLAGFGGEAAEDALLCATLAFAIEIPSFILLKKAIRRDRPYVVIASSLQALQPSDQFSMPSGHTAAAFLTATLVTLFVPSLFALAMLWAILVGVSRVVLGVHYPSDIAAGALLGASSAALAAAVIL